MSGSPSGSSRRSRGERASWPSRASVRPAAGPVVAGNHVEPRPTPTVRRSGRFRGRPRTPEGGSRPAVVAAGRRWIRLRRGSHRRTAPRRPQSRAGRSGGSRPTAQRQCRARSVRRGGPWCTALGRSRACGPGAAPATDARSNAAGSRGPGARRRFPVASCTRRARRGPGLVAGSTRRNNLTGRPAVPAAGVLERHCPSKPAGSSPCTPGICRAVRSARSRQLPVRTGETRLDHLGDGEGHSSSQDEQCGHLAERRRPAVQVCGPWSPVGRQMEQDDGDQPGHHDLADGVGGARTPGCRPLFHERSAPPLCRRDRRAAIAHSLDPGGPTRGRRRTGIEPNASRNSS